MRIVIPGGSGQVGTFMARAFQRAGDEVIELSRTPRDKPWPVVQWDGRTTGDWVETFENADAVLNLAGRSVDCRYNEANRKAIIDSRTESTRVVGEAIRACTNPPKVWLQAGTATIYGHRFDAPNDEATGVVGDKPGVPDTWVFSNSVAQTWERVCNEADTPDTRKVILRTSMAMSPDPGGVFDVMYGFARRWLGGRMGDGKQFVSWIHDVDFYRAVNWLIERDDIAGAVNLSAPNPLPNAEFMRALRDVAGVRFGLPTPAWMLEIGTFLLRTESELVLKSRRVVPGRLLESGFEFDWPTWPEAARDLAERWRALRQG